MTASEAPLTLFATAPPSWSTLGEALDYLGGEFVERIGILEDLLAAPGIQPPSILAFDLGQIAEGLAGFIRGPEKLVFDDQTPDVETTARLARCATELARKIKHGVVKDPVDGLEHDVHRRSVSLLTTDLAHAAKGLGENTEWWYDQEQEERAQYWRSEGWPQAARKSGQSA